MTERHRPDDEAKLQKVLRADLPPARDPLFRIAVLERRERRRFRRQIVATIASAPAGAWALLGTRLVPSTLRRLVRDMFAA